MRIVFFGTPDLSVPTLDALVLAGHDVVLVVTQADKRRGRGATLTPSPVKAAAQRLGLPVSHRVKDALTVDADLGVLVAFGRIIKDEILAGLTILNLHPSLLPRWRGATPVEGAILAGDTRTGICIMQLQSAMDAGPIYDRYETAIETNETAAGLYERLFAEGNARLIRLLSAPLPTPTEQTGEPTYCGKIAVEDLHVNWQQSAEQIGRLTRVGRAWTSFRSKRFLILAAEEVEPAEVVDAQTPGSIDGVMVATGAGVLRLKTVQPEGKGPVDAKAWANGARITQGEHFEN